MGQTIQDRQLAVLEACRMANSLLTIKGTSDKEGYIFTVTNYAQGQENHWLKDSLDFSMGMKAGEIYRKEYTGAIKRVWEGYKA